MSSSSFTIPLQIIEVSGGKKLGIEVSFSDGNTSTGPILYLFDTGAGGFYAGIPSDVHFTPPPKSLGTVFNSYGSGLELTGPANQVNVSFPGSSLQQSFSVLAGVPCTIPQGNGKSFPLLGHFYGDFGAAPSFVPINQQNQFSLMTVLALLGSPYSDGFSIDLTNPNQPQVVAGLGNLRDSLPVTVNLTSDGDYPPPPQKTPSQSLPAYSRFLSGTLTVGSQPAVNVSLILDTGTAPVVVKTGKTVTSNYVPKQGEAFTLTVPPSGGQTVTLLNFQGGQIPVNQEPTDQDQPDGYINCGLTPFLGSQIAFDFQDGVLRFPAGTETP